MFYYYSTKSTYDAILWTIFIGLGLFTASDWVFGKLTCLSILGLIMTRASWDLIGS